MVALLEVVIASTIDGNLANDEIHLLILDTDGSKGTWTTVVIEGPAPGKRYGHTMSYKQPLIILFGGHNEGEPKNDTWVLYIDRTPLRWQKLIIDGDIPCDRVYHSSCTYNGSETEGAIMVFGGRDKDLNACNDLWTLFKQHGNVWKWSKNKGNTTAARFQVQ